jgi:hypothetical protein
VTSMARRNQKYRWFSSYFGSNVAQLPFAADSIPSPEPTMMCRVAQLNRTRIAGTSTTRLTIANFNV